VKVDKRRAQEKLLRHVIQRFERCGLRMRLVRCGGGKDVAPWRIEVCDTSRVARNFVILEAYPNSTAAHEAWRRNVAHEIDRLSHPPIDPIHIIAGH
jgi:hypothetical protein